MRSILERNRARGHGSVGTGHPAWRYRCTGKALWGSGRRAGGPLGGRVHFGKGLGAAREGARAAGREATRIARQASREFSKRWIMTG